MFKLFQIKTVSPSTVLHKIAFGAKIPLLFVRKASRSPLGWSEKHKSWKIQQFKADSEPRHSTDFRTIFGIMIG